jgi:hypothetical protein
MLKYGFESSKVLILECKKVLIFEIKKVNIKVLFFEDKKLII